MKIPKIIHQTWKNEQIPQKWVAFQKKVQALHPDWEYKLWTDSDNDIFVKQHFPDFYPIFNALPENVMRADVIRYLIMYQVGGVYLDLDYEMLKPFDLKDDELVLPKNRSTQSGDKSDSLGNAFLASIPQHDFWKFLIDELQNNPPIGKQYEDVESGTGPIFITHIFQKYPNNNISTPEKNYFHPTTPRNAADYQKVLQTKESYGIHHCHGSWRKMPVRLYFLERFLKKTWKTLT